MLQFSFRSKDNNEKKLKLHFYSLKQKSQSRWPIEIVVHPKYDNGEHEYDIALIKVKQC